MSKIFYAILVVFTIISLSLIGFLGYVVWDASQTEEAELPLDNGIYENGDIIDNVNIDNEAALEIDFILNDLAAAIKRPKIAVLTYHHLDPYLRNNPVTITPTLFNNHLKHLQNSNYKPLSYRNLTRFISISEKVHELGALQRDFTEEELAWIDDSYRFVRLLPDRAYHITFDDGYESNYIYAYPLLRDAQIPATFFVIVRSSFKEHQTAPDWINFPHFTWEQLKLMQRLSYFEVQSHSYSLHAFEMIGGRTASSSDFESSLFQDLTLSRSYLENRLRPHLVDGLAFPYGGWNNTIIAQAKKAGIRYMFTSRNGVVDHNTVAELIPRIDVGSADISATKLLEILDAKFSD